jgi:hypothetical protein
MRDSTARAEGTAQRGQDPSLLTVPHEDARAIAAEVQFNVVRDEAKHSECVAVVQRVVDAECRGRSDVASGKDEDDAMQQEGGRLGRG